MWYAESGTEGDSQKTPFAIEVGVFSPTFPKLLGHLAPTTGLITHLDLGCEGVAGHWKIKSGLGTGATALGRLDRRGGTTDSKSEINYLVLRGQERFGGWFPGLGFNIWWKVRPPQYNGRGSFLSPHSQPLPFSPSLSSWPAWELGLSSK